MASSISPNFNMLLFVRMVAVLGAALAVSPVFGLISDDWIATLFGHNSLEYIVTMR